MSVRNTGGLDFPTLPAFLGSRPMSVIVAAKLTTTDAALASDCYLFSAYDENSGGNNGWTEIHASEGQLFMKDRGGSGSHPSGQQELNVDYNFGQYSDKLNTWLWFALSVESLSSRNARVNTAKSVNTAVYEFNPSFTKASVAENLHPDFRIAQMHFLSGPISDAAWAGIIAGTQSAEAMAGYIDGFEFRDSLASKNGVLSLTARGTPQFDAADMPNYSGGGGTPEPSPAGKILFAGMCV